MRTPWEPVRAGLGVGLLLMLVFCNIAISAEGALRFYPPEIDFGARLTGEKVLVSTSVLNVSSDDVLIKMIKSSCHCTALKSGDMYVPSGKRLDLIFEIDGVGVNGVLEAISQPNFLQNYKLAPAHDLCHNCYRKETFRWQRNAGS